MDAAVEVRLDREGSFILALLLSLLFHGIFALFVLVSSLRAPGSAASPFEVELLKPEDAQKRFAKAPSPKDQAAAAPQPPEAAVAPPKNQIVAPPESPEEKSDKARLFSDRDSKALEEMV